MVILVVYNILHNKNKSCYIVSKDSKFIIWIGIIKKSEIKKKLGCFAENISKFVH